jgi:hypothetical protein
MSFTSGRVDLNKLYDKHVPMYRAKVKVGNTNIPDIYDVKKMRNTPWANNLRAIYARAKQNGEEGKSWYKEANVLAQGLADKYKLELGIVAQVIATLSPSVKWDTNVKDAVNLIDAFYKRGYLGAKSITVSTYGPQKEKAIQILLGNTLIGPYNGGLKVYNFYKNILDPSNSFYVTIDRHAARILVGDDKRPKPQAISHINYVKYAAVYKLIAQELKIKPCELQAITWVQFRKELGIK